MEVDQIQCKLPRVSNGPRRPASTKLGKMDEGKRDDDSGRGGGVDLGGGVGRIYGWPSSRIVRVSRASGGKDRHSKVLTSKGLRDRRVRLSVNTAIQFYDLQDRLGYDQPSKAVEWLLKAAAGSIDELPPMSSPFPDTPKQLSDEKRSSTAGSDQLGFDSGEVDMDIGGGVGNSGSGYLMMMKSSAACSSNSETSKGSGLSLSRSESRIKARERAKERAAVEKEKEKENESNSHVASLNPISQTTSFTELLNGGISNSINPNSSVSQNPNRGGGDTNESTFFQRSPRHWSDYVNTGLLGPPATRPVASPLFSVAELQNFSFAPENLVSAAGGNSNSNNNNNNHHNGSSEYNLNFTISPASSSGLAAFNRGTLQSNSSPPSSLFPHIQRFPTTDGSSPNFFIGAAAPVENHHHFLSGLQLYYGDAHSNNDRHAGQKGKGKN